MNASEARKASSAYAASFLEEFADGKPWAHLDIAGTAWDQDNRDYVGKGATGWGVRLLVELARSRGANVMDFDLTAEQELIQPHRARLRRQEVAPVAEELDRTKTFPYEIVAKLGELGLMGIPFPEEYGGGGADTLAYALAIEELTRIDASCASRSARTRRSARCRSTFGAPTSRSATGCRSCAPAAGSAAFGLTEPEAGSDAGNVAHARRGSRTASG